MAYTWTSDKAYGIDVYEGAPTLNIPKGAIDFVVVRLGWMDKHGVYKNPIFAEQIQQVWNAGAVPMAYFPINTNYFTWHNHALGDLKKMTNDRHPLIAPIIEQLRAGNWWKKVGALFIDMETDGAGDVWNAAVAEDIRDRLIDMSRTNAAPPWLRVGVYSRQSWMKENPAVVTWLEQHPEVWIWPANYVTTYPGVHRTLAEHKAKSRPLSNQNPIIFGLNDLKPKTLPLMWQFHGTFPGGKYATCPEVLTDKKTPAGLDLNLLDCTREELFALFGWTDPLKDGGTPPPPPPPVVDETDLEKRVDALEEKVKEMAAALAYHNLRGAV